MKKLHTTTRTKRNRKLNLGQTISLKIDQQTYRLLKKQGRISEFVRNAIQNAVGR